MRRLCARLSVLLFLLSAGSLYAQHYTLDFFAMQSAVEQLEFRLTRGSNVAVVNVTSPSRQLSDRVLNELNARMIEFGVIMINRERVTLVLEEAGLNLFGNISDVMMQSVGRRLNVQAIISVEVDDMRDHYQMRFRMINVETAAILAQPVVSINKDRVRGPPPNTPQLNTVGISWTPSLSGMIFAGVVRGTFSPFDNFFVEGGMELGFWSWNSHYLESSDGARFGYREIGAIHPYVNAGLFLPFARRGGWYAAAGIGLRFVEYRINSGRWEGDVTLFVVNLTTGFNLFNWLDVSYTLRTNFRSVENRLSLGYVYRFMPRD